MQEGIECSSYSVLRTEKKYEIPPDTRSVLTTRLSKIMDMDRYSGARGYLVRSLYFDSIGDDDFLDKINGLESRKKIRLRTYSLTQPWIKLELKQKQGAVQMKKTLQILPQTAIELMRGHFAPLLAQEGSFPKELYQMLSCGLYRPRCIVEYRRKAFTAQANDTRITIDTDIRVSRHCERFFEPAAVFTPLLGPSVLEVKYNGFLLEQCREAIRTADIPEMSFSKYEMARRALH